MQMVKCPSCGEENPAKFRLCGYCGTPLAPAAAALPPQEVRKTVTLLFTDLKDSTALGERLDSEALHEVKERYFAAMSAEIERHGGKIEKFDFEVLGISRNGGLLGAPGRSLILIKASGGTGFNEVLFDNLTIDDRFRLDGRDTLSRRYHRLRHRRNGMRA